MRIIIKYFYHDKDSYTHAGNRTSETVASEEPMNLNIKV